MMRHILACIALSAVASVAVAQDYPDEALSKAGAERSESNLIVEMTITPGAFEDRANREVWLRPVITDGRDSLWLRPVLIAGRTRYYQRARYDGKDPGYVMLRSGREETYSYSAVVPYREWMETSSIEVVCRTCGCCGEAKGEVVKKRVASLDFKERIYEPALVYVMPEREETKAREARGAAFIDFKVNSSVIDPGYRGNERELAKVRATVDAINNDGDISITSLSVKGFASPDGPYAKNETLARDRTKALADYIRELYSFPGEVTRVTWVAEDWDGLIRWIEERDMEAKDEILALVTNDSEEPDRREYILRTRYPEQYAKLLSDAYPSLRRCDYVVNYTVNQYTDVEEIASVLASDPRKLSLAELFQLSQSLGKDSPRFKEVMEVAVRMFPDSEVANLNAAVTALSYKDTGKARWYLKRAGNSPEATYTAGLAEACDGNYDKALRLFGEAESAGVAEAGGEIAKLLGMGFATPGQDTGE